MSLTSGIDLVVSTIFISGSFFNGPSHGLAVLLKNDPIPPFFFWFAGT